MVTTFSFQNNLSRCKKMYTFKQCIYNLHLYTCVCSLTEHLNKKAWYLQIWSWWVSRSTFAYMFACRTAQSAACNLSVAGFVDGCPV